MNAPASNLVSPESIKPPVQVVAIGLEESSLTAIRVALVNGDHGLLSVYPDYLRVFKDGRLASSFRQSDGVIYVIEFGDSKDVALRTASEIQHWAEPRSTLVALSSSTEPGLILDAMRAGCNEYLTTPLQADQFRQAIANAQARWMLKDTQPEKRSGRVIGLLGVKGGAGSTTIAVHLATFMAKCHNKRTILVDQHRQLGHVALFCGVDAPSYHLYDAVRSVDRLDSALLNSLVKHHSSGVDLLASPGTFDKVADVSLYDLERTLHILAENYEYVFVDCSPQFIDEMLSVASCCDDLFLVTTQEVSALRDLSRYVDQLLERQVSPDKLKIVVNRYSADRALTVQQIEGAIRRPVSVCVANSASEITKATDSGAPIAPDRNSEFTRGINKWAASLLPPNASRPSVPKRRFIFW